MLAQISLKLVGSPLVAAAAAALLLLLSAARGQEDTNFRFRGPAEQPSLVSGGATPSPSSTSSSSSSLVWQPLRASFRPSTRQPLGPLPATTGAASTLSSSWLSPTEPSRSESQPPAGGAPPELPTPAPFVAAPDDEQPTRTPMNRFRPSRPPATEQPSSSLISFGPNWTTSGGSASSSPTTSATTTLATGSGSSGLGNSFVGPSSGSSFGPGTLPTLSSNVSAGGGASAGSSLAYRITRECFECLCEAATSCNVNSRCQTSDVRHTRCGSYLISYNQWLETGLSSELVTREALARDPAADERAFYECVTQRECAERLIGLYMAKNAYDCDKDGRLDCYDVAAIHQGGTDQCRSEPLLDSQYWSDFNACFGFGR